MLTGGGIASEEDSSAYSSRLTPEAAISTISGQWWGDRGESYDVDQDTWECRRFKHGATNTYSLDWDSERELIIWGRSYYLDPREAALSAPSSHGGGRALEVAWYAYADAASHRRPKRGGWSNAPPKFSWTREALPAAKKNYAQPPGANAAAGADLLAALRY